MKAPAEVVAIQTALQQSKTKDEFAKILCVWLKVALSLTSTQIAIGLGQKPAAVRKTQSRFAKQGISAFFRGPRGGRRRENISIAREKQILEKFLRRAKRGTVLNLSEIQKAYELSVGRPVAQSTVYRLIARHGLRRYLPQARANRLQNSKVTPKKQPQ